MDGNLHTLGKRATDFVKAYREAKEEEATMIPAKHPTTWSPPAAEYLKLNFDGVVSGDSLWGWGFVL